MDVSNFLLLVNIFVYFVIVSCGFAISNSLGVSRISSGGCLLSSTLKPYNSGIYLLVYSNKFNCEFPIYSGVIFCIFYALGMAIYNLYTINKAQRDPSIVSQMWVFPFILLNSVVTVLMLVASCMVSVGFKELCDSLTKAKHKYYPSCIEAENQNLQLLPTKETTSTGRFYTLINNTQNASWICTVCWLVLVIFGIVQFVLNRRQKTHARQEVNEPNQYRTDVEVKNLRHI
ncbi:transmembrane protein 179B-like [Saccostrea cucullata]|uniref:transmembrane protein 179B-like n=1 Tax=Saccostrea cuccullata TaxID=36930 RepID=UPI002ED687F6